MSTEGDDNKSDINNSSSKSMPQISNNVNGELKLDDNKNDKFNPKVNVAIDFGTNGTAIAYTLVGESQNVYIYSKWKTVNSQGVSMNSNKDRTAILLNKQLKCEAFGIKAIRAYASMNNKSNYYFFDNFKMNLYKDESICKGKSELKDKLTAANGTNVDSSVVFIEAFKYLKEQILLKLNRDFRKNDVKIKIESIYDIQWIVTIPAIWNDIAKNKMITWIEKAGLISKNIKDHCLLKYEPDCASLSLQNQLLIKKIQEQNDDIDVFLKFNNLYDNHNIQNHKNLLNKQKYILIDSGGGTIDIACHQFINDYTVKELHYPTGGPWGDMYIDAVFNYLFCDIIGKTNYKKIQFNGSAMFDLHQNFVKSKQTFKDKGNGKMHNIALPPELLDEIDDIMDIDVFEEIINKVVWKGNKNCFEYSDGMLSIDCLIWKKYFFDPLICHVISLVKMLLTKDIMKDCNYIYLVGGYTLTPYYQNAIKKQFGKKSKYKMDIIIPLKPILSVVDGAARFGLLKNKKIEYVRMRVMSKTYGECLSISFYEIDVNNFEKEYIKNNKWTDEYGGEWLDGYFETYVKKGDSIPYNNEFTFHSFRSKTDKLVVINIYSSNKVNPKTKNDGELLCSYILTWPVNDNSTHMITKAKFGETIQLMSYVETNPNAKVKCDIKYEWK